MSETPFDNESIAERFEEATRALQDLSGNIERLSEHEATQQVAADNISEASSHFAEFTTAAQTVAGLMSDANARVAAALDTAETFLEGTDLSQMQDEVRAMKEETAEIVKILEESLLAQIQTEMKVIQDQTAVITKILNESLVAQMRPEMKAIQDQTAVITKILNESLKAVEDRVDAGEQQKQQLETQLADLNADHQDQALELKVAQDRIARLPEKVRKKHGL